MSTDTSNHQIITLNAARREIAARRDRLVARQMDRTRRRVRGGVGRSARKKPGWSHARQELIDQLGIEYRTIVDQMLSLGWQ